MFLLSLFILLLFHVELFQLVLIFLEGLLVLLVLLRYSLYMFYMFNGFTLITAWFYPFSGLTCLPCLIYFTGFVFFSHRTVLTNHSDFTLLLVPVLCSHFTGFTLVTGFTSSTSLNFFVIDLYLLNVGN